jgi:hypothetical protein
MIYIQSNTEKTRPHHFDCSTAMFGAIETEVDYKLTSIEDVKSGKWDALIRRNLFVGSVEFMREVFLRIGILDVRLPKNSNRDFEVITLGEAKSRSKSGEKLFIKPIEIKLFTGFVLDDFSYTSISDISDDELVMVYKPFNTKIKSEWRCYIHNKKVTFISNYSGDIFTYPDKNYLDKVISENVDFPIAYTIDIGILDSGENVVVEFNDMCAIGNYGIPNDMYLKALKDRYFEIVKSV